jgi:lycopene beta-cyclase
MNSFDYILIGGGLQNGLILLALDQWQPNARVAIIEALDRLGGNHTWSFHAADVPCEGRELIQRIVTIKWPAYSVYFPNFARVIPSEYASITAENFNSTLSGIIRHRNWYLRLGCRAVSTKDNLVILETGETLQGQTIVDARGPRAGSHQCGYQKFLGLEVETSTPWLEQLPCVMDAQVDQCDGFHFLYVLPFSQNRVLIEDTYFSDNPIINEARSRNLISDYLNQRVSAWRIVRSERGVLPMPWRMKSLASQSNLLVGGYAGGWFHPATGYSFPLALRLAAAIARVPPHKAYEVAARLARQIASRQQFAMILNWLLFRLVPPECRWQVYARIYRTLPATVLARFYAFEFCFTDAARILLGRPPRINIFRALRLQGAAYGSRQPLPDTQSTADEPHPIIPTATA